MKRGLIAGGVCLIAFAFGPVAHADARTIGAGKMTLSVTIEKSVQAPDRVVFLTQGAIKIKSPKQKNCRKSRSVTYRATDPNGQRIQLLAKLSRGNGTYIDRNTFVYDIDGIPAPEEVPIQGGTYTIQAQVPKQKDLKSRDRCRKLVSPAVAVVVPPFQTPTFP